VRLSLAGAEAHLPRLQAAALELSSLITE